MIFCAATVITLSSPYGTKKFFKELDRYLSDKAATRKRIGLTPKNLSQTIYRLKKRKLINIKTSGGKTIIELTENGIRKKIEGELNNAKIPKPAFWDEKWRIVFFDIPENHKKSRHSLRNKLKHLGFIQFQKSVWIYPYNCHNEINFLAETLDVSQYLTLITASIENDTPLRKIFQNILKN